MILKLAVEKGNINQVTPENSNFWSLRSRYGEVTFYEIPYESIKDAEMCLRALNQEPKMIKHLSKFKVGD